MSDALTAVQRPREVVPLHLGRCLKECTDFCWSSVVPARLNNFLSLTPTLSEARLSEVAASSSNRIQPAGFNVHARSNEWSIVLKIAMFGRPVCPDVSLDYCLHTAERRHGVHFLYISPTERRFFFGLRGLRFFRQPGSFSFFSVFLIFLRGLSFFSGLCV